MKQKRKKFHVIWMVISIAAIIGMIGFTIIPFLF